MQGMLSEGRRKRNYEAGGERLIDLSETSLARIHHQGEGSVEGEGSWGCSRLTGESFHAV